MGLGVGDLDRDGLLDLIKTHFADDIPALYRSLGRGQFEDVAIAAGLGVQNRYVEWGAGTADLDNDGRPDLFYATGNVYPEIEALLPQYPHRSPKIVFRNLRRRSLRGRLRPQRAGRHRAALEPRRRVRGLRQRRRPGRPGHEHERAAVAATQRLRGGNGWLELRLEGKHSNRAAIGATVVVTAGGRRQARAVLSQSSYYSHDDLRLHFGLGAARAAELVEVRWPSGTVDLLRDVAAGRLRTLREGKRPPLRHGRSRRDPAALGRIIGSAS